MLGVAPGGVGRIGASTLNQGVGAAAYAPYAAPNGWRWDFITERGLRVTERSIPVVTLVRAS